MSKSRPVVRSEEKTVGYGYVGRWRAPDQTLGWSMPSCVGGYAGQNERPSKTDWNKGEPHFLCKITIEEVLDSRGRRIVYYPGGKSGKHE